MGKTGFEDFFRRAAEAVGVDSQSELAELLHVHRSALTQAKRKGSVPKAWILTLATTYGLDPDWLETGRGQPRGRERGPDEDFFRVPKVRARLCAGGGSFETDAAISGYFSFRRDWLARKGSPERMVLMDVVGQSMEPEIRHGDMALIDQSQESILAHGVYAVGVEDTVMVKRLEKRPGRLVLLSDNRDYAPIILEGEEIGTLRVIGRVVWIGREL